MQSCVLVGSPDLRRTLSTVRLSGRCRNASRGVKMWCELAEGSRDGYTSQGSLQKEKIPRDRDWDFIIGISSQTYRGWKVSQSAICEPEKQESQPWNSAQVWGPEKQGSEWNRSQFNSEDPGTREPENQEHWCHISSQPQCHWGANFKLQPGSIAVFIWIRRESKVESHWHEGRRRRTSLLKQKELICPSSIFLFSSSP